ncbi:MAG TPA: PepSY-like domain-containing protein [Aequorivita sp.]|nr:PepSY-like domain-containing protein [Aequorivita sp.]
MKTLKIFMMFFFATGLVMAQDIKPTDLPEAVRKAFLKGNAQATDVEWKKDMENYKVEFDIGRMEHEIWYTPSGTVIKKEQEMTEADLPQAIRDVIKSKYSGYRVDDVEMTWHNNTTTYEVELEKGKEEWEVTFDSNGKILRERRD